MPARKASPSRPRKDWYSISVDTLRGWGLVLGILAVAGLGWLIFNSWERLALEREAKHAVEEVRDQLGRISPESLEGDLQMQYNAAFASFEQAQSALARAAYKEALASASQSRRVLQSILEALSPGGGGQARFNLLQGEVEYRRANGGDWEEARTHLQLHPGDYVRTGTGSAEILFVDGTHYLVRPNTQIILSAARPAEGGGTEQSVQVEYGWLGLDTAERASKVVTPAAEARVREKSEAFVTFDRTSRRGRFAAVRGNLELTAKGGLKRQVGELEQVVQTGDLLSEPHSLPAPPQLLAPLDNLEVSSGDRRLVLAWGPVAGASRYALEVSRSHLFVDNIIAAHNRTKTRATLGIQGEGTFQWRVAAYDREGQLGPWSPARKFRVATFESAGGSGDKTPPALDLEDVRAYGSIFIVGGKSDPGSEVYINDEAVAVEADGSFKKAIQLTKEGWSFIEVRAVDGSNNKAVKRERVFVENR